MAVPIDWSSAIATGINAFGGLLGSGISQSYNRENMALQSQYAKELMDYQWSKYQSPEAQVAAMTRAGLNPAVMFGSGGKGAFAAPSSSMPSSSPIQVPNVFDISSTAAFIKSVADAKKAGMDTKLSEQEIKNKEVERQLNEFNLDLQKQFGKSFKSVELEKAYKDLLLSVDSHDLRVQEKALNDWRIVTEKAVSSIKESEREIALQRLANNPTAISLENELMKEKAKTEKAQQGAFYSQSKVSNASAEQIELFNKIYSDSRYKHSLITQAVEAGRSAVEQRKLTKSQAEHMSYMVEQAAYSTDMQEFTYWSNQIQGFVHSVGEAASSFYGAGALRELIKVRQIQTVRPNPVHGFAP